MNLELELSGAIDNTDKGSFIVTLEQLWSMDHVELEYAESVIQQLPTLFPNYTFYVQDDHKSGGKLFRWERNYEHRIDQGRSEEHLQSTELVGKG